MINPNSPFFLTSLEQSGFDWTVTYAIETGTGGTQEAEVKLSYLLGNISEHEHEELLNLVSRLNVFAAFVDTDVSDKAFADLIAMYDVDANLLSEMNMLIDMAKAARSDEANDERDLMGIQTSKALAYYAGRLEITKLFLSGLLDQDSCQFSVMKRKGYVHYRAKLPAINLKSNENTRKAVACPGYSILALWLTEIEAYCTRLVNEAVNRQTAQLDLFAQGKYESPFEEAQQEVDFDNF